MTNPEKPGRQISWEVGKFSLLIIFFSMLFIISIKELSDKMLKTLTGILLWLPHKTEQLQIVPILRVSVELGPQNTNRYLDSSSATNSKSHPFTHSPLQMQ